jgi:hypothetical protein
VGCSGAGGAWNCKRGAVEMADDGEQSRRRWSGGGAERRRSRGSEMRPRERVKVVEEGSWTLCRAKKSTGELEQLLPSGGVTWRLRAAGGGAEQQRETEREGREEDDEDLSVFFQKSKGYTV